MSSDTGAPWSLPYPDLPDAPDAPDGTRALAKAVAAALGRAVPCTSSTRPGHAAGLLIYETDTGILNRSDGASWNLLWQDSGFITSGFSAQTGWSNVACAYRLIGRWAFVHIECSRTGADLGFGANGGLSDEAVVQVPAVALNADSTWQSEAGSYNTGSGSFAFAFRQRSDTGMFQIISGMPSTTIHSGDGIYADFITRPA